MKNHLMHVKVLDEEEGNDVTPEKLKEDQRKNKIYKLINFP